MDYYGSLFFHPIIFFDRFLTNFIFLSGFLVIFFLTGLFSKISANLAPISANLAPISANLAPISAN